jgi:hypothetical protein
MPELRVTHGEYGFAWGPVYVQRTTEIDGRVVLTVTTDTGQSIDIYVSRTGRSLRVFKKGHGELT